MAFGRIVVLLCMGALLAGISGTEAASLIDDAKKEGSVVLYGTMTNVDLQRLSAAFEKKYPFMKVEMFRGNSERVLNRVLTEARTGSYLADVINLDGINGLVLKEKGLLQPHKSAETEAFPEDFRDPEGLLPCCLYIVTNVIGYNTKLVSKAEAPKAYSDLLQPKWKGKLGMDADEGEWFTALISIWGREKTVQFFRELMKQGVSLHRGHTLLAQLNAAGEFPVAVNVFGYRPLEMQTQGAPIDIVNADPVVARPWGIFLARRAPHPNAGRLFIDYVLSEDGQKVIASFGRTVVRPGVKQKFPRLVEGLKLYPVKPEMGRDHAEISKLYYSIVK
ncbi:MAG: extracellular solute-binding protein [Deltaproteobacteria bacterium]|nr:extracellular solute-binding protein [Deltaproteobacteria bacterium]